MNITGIIAEYNPFHQGHAFHLTKAREMTDAEYLIVVMSGNYVQRGAPAMFDKYTRARAALLGGADLVLELPLCAACGSAEYFARGAVSLLNETGIVTDLCFGSECGDLALLTRIARILTEEPPAFQESLRQALRSGLSFPRARAAALTLCDPALPQEAVNQPNNLLGLEYLKALERLQSPIRPHTLTRQGCGYHELQITSERFASASAIRRTLIESQGSFARLSETELPFPELYDSYESLPPITEDAFSLPLLQKLRTLQDEDLSVYFDVGEELSARIWKHLDSFASFSQFTDLLKTRNLTRTAVSRALLHILLNLREYGKPEHFRVLGFRKDADVLLKELSVHGKLPIVTNPAASSLTGKEVFADHLYESVRSLLHGQPFQNEFRRKMLVI